MENNILYAKKNQDCFIKMVGHIKYFNSSGFDAFLQAEFKKGEVKNFIIDLRNVLSIDSTNLGLLAKIANSSQTKFQKKPSIISTSEEINSILSLMGFNQVFNITDHWDDLPENYMKTDDFKHGLRESVDLVLESHKTLMAISEKNQQEFAEIVRLIEKNT